MHEISCELAVLNTKFTLFLDVQLKISCFIICASITVKKAKIFPFFSFKQESLERRMSFFRADFGTTIQKTAQIYAQPCRKLRSNQHRNNTRENPTSTFRTPLTWANLTRFFRSSKHTKMCLVTEVSPRDQRPEEAR